MKSLAFTLTRGACAVALALASPSFLARAEAPAGLRERQQKIQKIAGDVSRAVIAIVPDFEAAKARGESAVGSGSGVVVTEDGLIMTAAHVLQAVGKEFEVILSNGDRVKAKSLGKNYGRDAGLAQITEAGKYPHVERAKGDGLSEGEWCVALGHSGGPEVDRSAPLRLGRVLETDVDGFIVTDCTLSGGDSGGPLFNLEGKLIGIHSSIGWRTAENRHVPMAAFEKNWDRLLKGDEWGRLGMRERPQRPARPRTPEAEPSETPEFANQPSPDQPFLGVLVVPSEAEGALVETVEPGSPARKAGVKIGDLITKINDREVTDGADLISTIRGHKPGDEITLVVEREGKKLEVKTKLVAFKELKNE
jgi:S1-C subfamily serine protease